MNDICHFMICSLVVVLDFSAIGVIDNEPHIEGAANEVILDGSK